MELIAISENGVPARSIPDLPDVAWEVLESTAGMYRAGTYQPPWVGYLAVEDLRCVGTCAFKTAPTNDRVEIAYFTFPGHEGRGVATRMGAALMDIARQHAPGVRICAQTLPAPGASTRVLEKLGFRRVAEIQHHEDGTVWEWEAT